ncbi:GNAT family N-acetyltransferase [Pontibacter litorisediminis]|uniref:GNAT family N-acetyltransferase n=1 Tax=Pontibacter litorisediminis TaxID=1846260 RepID=UPI0023EC0312|nr:GNAT family N-acetyltransferase [Pontibacter litorisediminis]
MQKDTVSNLGPKILSAPKVEVITGDGVYKLLSDVAFLSGWTELYEACPWATVFQSKEFVSVWYKVFGQEHLPIVVKEELNGKLTGLLTLAKDVKGLGITAAGGYNAYYHTWLVADYDDDRFIKRALAEVRKLFPQQKITLKYIPPNTPLGWLKADAYWAARYTIRPFKRPVMNFNDPDIARFFSKKRFRESRNRLKRQGELVYDQITDYSALVSVFDELADQYDFRKGATLGKAPFRKNPLKKVFLLSLFKENVLHVRVLRLNGKIIASLIATEGKNKWVHGAGINTHHPQYARFSPGYMIMMMLGQQLCGEGYQAFDLTPGGHDYKEGLANAHDQLYELTVVDRWTAFSTKFINKYIRSRGKLFLSGTGITSEHVKRDVRNWLRHKKEQWWLVQKGHIQAALKNEDIRHAHDTELFVVDRAVLKNDVSVPIEVNSLHDLLAYGDGEGRITFWRFIEDSSQRFEGGEECFTWVKEGRLMACAWQLPTAKKDGVKASLPEEAIVLDGVYCHDGGQADLAAFLLAVLARIGGSQVAYVAVSAANKPFSAALEQAGLSKLSAGLDQVRLQV